MHACIVTLVFRYMPLVSCNPIISSIYIIVIFFYLLSHAYIVLLSRKCRNCGWKTVSLPLLGEVTHLSLGVFVFCISFAVFWAANRHASYAWIGQDVLVSFMHYLRSSLFFLLLSCIRTSVLESI